MTESARRFAVVGGGLAGLVLVDELLERGADAKGIVVVDGDDSVRGSDNPGATFHPFPGGSIEADRRKLRAARAFLDLADRWKSRWADPPITTFPMVRPLGDDSRSRRLVDSWPGPGAYPDWVEIERLDAAELAELDGRLSCWDGAFLYEPARSVDLERLRRDYLAYFRNRGVDVHTGVSVETLRRTDGRWRCETGEDRVSAERVVLAIGRAMDRWFPDLAMECRGGELLVVDSRVDDLEVAIHAEGHVAPRPGGGLVAGATWWNPAEIASRSDRAARTEILHRCRPVLESLEGVDAEIWRGVRAGFGDYQPLVGPIPGYEGLHALGGFGGTALLGIPEHARGLAASLTGGSETIRPLARADRMGADKWRSTPERIVSRQGP